MVGITFHLAIVLEGVLVSYVRFGARKKLVKAGYCLPNPVEVASGLTTTQQTTSTSREDPSSTSTKGGEVASGNQVAPVLKMLNKFWAFGFRY